MSEAVSQLVAIKDIKPHKRNYRSHPDDEIEHLMASIRSNGIYRNIVIAQDGTILAGHGVVEAARRLGMESLPVYRTDYGPNDPRALKLLVSDNEIAHLAMNDDRALTELLRELKDADVDLLGTGYDEMMLANLLFVTRPASEIEDIDAAAQWVGLPEYDEGEDHIQITMNFACQDDCDAFCRMLNLGMGKTAMKGAKKSFWWPVRAQDDNISIRFASTANGEKEPAS